MLAVMALEGHGFAPRSGPWWSPAPPGASARSRLQFFATVAFRSRRRPGARKRPIISQAWARARSSNAKKLAGPAKPLEKQCWAGAVDCVASTTLVNMLALTRYGGAVATCGLTGSIDLPTSVAPFILRGASLLGIESVMRPVGDGMGRSGERA